ncbi:hypothetical protein ACQ4PT_064790 [Festuca glaucescens]
MATQMTAGDDIMEQEASATLVVQWSALPYDVLAMIRSRVASPRDRVRFTGVCKPWHDAASCHPSPPALPLLLLSAWYGQPYGNPAVMKSLYCLEDAEVMRVQPPRAVWSNWHVGGHDGGWIALWQSDQVEPPNLIVIVNLFSGAEVALSEKQRTFKCNVCSPHGFLIHKIAFSEAPTSSSCVLAAMTNTCRVAVCKVGCPDYGWITQGCRQRENLKDIAFCNGELYGITSYGEKLFKYDIGVDNDDAPVITAAHLLVTQSYNSPTKWSINDESVVYLIELRCKLVMAVRARLLPPECETSFNLFKLVNNADGYRWAEMRSLEDHALFVGPKCSMAVHVPVGGHQGVHRNKIYYSSHRPVKNIKSFSDVVYLTRTDDNDPMYRRQDKRVSDDEIKSIGYYVKVSPCTPTWLHGFSLQSSSQLV